jgi:type IV pilus secretin PilQ/predicted competence protein
MFARRLVVIIMLVALVGNLGVLAAAHTITAAPEGQTFTLTSLKHETVGVETRILIESSAPPLYTVFRPSQRLIVVDLPGGESDTLQPQYAIKNQLVDTVVVRQARSAATGRAITHVEINVSGDVRDRSSVNGNTLTIALAPERQAANYATEQSNASGVYVYPTPMVKGNKPAEHAPVKTVANRVEPTSERNTEPKPERARPTPTRAATVIERVWPEARGAALRVVIDTDGAAQFKDFMLANPWRIVVDITGVRSAVGNKTETVASGVVERLRVGQPSPNVVRIVLDAKSKVNYRVERDGQSLIITVGDDHSERRDATPAAMNAQVAARATANAEASKPVETKAEPKATDLKQTDVKQSDVKQADVKQADVKAAARPASDESKPETKASVKPEAKVEAKSEAKSDAKNDAKAAANATQKEVKVAGQRVENKSADNKPPANVLAQNQSAPQQATRSAITRGLTAQPNSSNPVKETVTTSGSAPSANPVPSSGYNPPAQPAYVRSVSDVPRNSSPATSAPAQRQRGELAFCDPSYVGGLISFDLRAGVDIRDMLRFISQQYGVNFIVDKSVSAVPVDIRVSDMPWNHVMEEVLRANRLGAVCGSNGRIIRIATLEAIKQEEFAQQEIAEAQALKIPLVTEIIHLKYARAFGALGQGGGGRSGGGSSSGGLSSGGASGGGGQGSLLSVITTRLSKRGRIEMDSRTNSLIVTDLPENMQIIKDMISKLDKPEPQVEIEARIVIASRNFLRDLGVELAAGVLGSNGRAGVFETSPMQLSRGSLTPGGANGSGGGSGGSSGGSSSGSGSSSVQSLGPNLPNAFPSGGLRGGTPNSVLGLTTMMGTGLLTTALTANETKGQIRTIASPRITTTDNKTAEIVNGVQIPVQTSTNNTITTTFVTAALRLEITPQIVEETGEVQMHIVAENNTVNTALANQFNGGTPGINTQSAESTVLVQDGGTAVMGGINVDTEGHTINRTPGLSRLPVVGELFKRRTVRRDSDEILFFITPRIVHENGLIGPRTPQRSSVEGQPNPNAPQRAAAPANNQPAQAPTTAANGKGGQ